MNEQTAELLRELARQLGTTTEFLWGVLIYQARVSAIKDLIFFFLLPLPIWGLYRGWTYTIDLIKTSEGPDQENIGVVWTIVLIVITAMTVIASLTLIGQLYTVPDRLLNPDYWALEQILKEIQ